MDFRTRCWLRDLCAPGEKVAAIYSPVGAAVKGLSTVTGASDEDVLGGVGGLLGGVAGAGLGFLPSLLVPEKNTKTRKLLAALGIVGWGTLGAVYGAGRATTAGKEHEITLQHGPKDLLVFQGMDDTRPNGLPEEMKDKEPFRIVAHGGGQPGQHMLGSKFWGRMPIGDVIAENKEKIKGNPDWSLSMDTCNANGLCYPDLVSALKKEGLPLPRELAMVPPRSYSHARLTMMDPETGMPLSAADIDRSRDILRDTHNEMLSPAGEVDPKLADDYFIRRMPFLSEKNDKEIGYMNRFFEHMNRPSNFSERDIQQLGYPSREAFNDAYGKQQSALRDTVTGAWQNTSPENLIQESVVQTQVRPGSGRGQMLADVLGVGIGASPTKAGQKTLQGLQRSLLIPGPGNDKGTAEGSPLREALNRYDILRASLGKDEALSVLKSENPGAAAAVKSAIDMGIILARSGKHNLLQALGHLPAGNLS